MTQDIRPEITVYKRRTQSTPLIIKAIAALLPIFALVTAFYPIADNWTMGLFMGSVLVIAFAILPASKRQKDLNSIPFYDWIAMALVIGTVSYYILAYEELNLYIGAYSTWQYVVMAVALSLTLEVARRAMGAVVPLIAIVLIALAIYQGFPSSIIITRAFVGAKGMFGSLTDVFFRYVFLFFIFGALMQRAGASSFLQRYLNSVSGNSNSASAKATMFGSGLFGMFMGSGAGNVAVSGSLTIPMMKKKGYASDKAAGIEAASGLGGELSPPIMGSAIFLLVAYAGVQYREIIVLSILPAILYYLPIYLIIHFEGQRDKKTVSAPAAGESSLRLLRDYAHLAIAPFVLVFLIAIGFSPTYAAAGGIVTIALLSQIQRTERLNIKDLVSALAEGTMNFVSLGAAAPVLAMILVVVLLIGLPSTLTTFAIIAAGDNIIFVMVATLMIALLLGMGMPIVASYMLLATIAAPALATFDVPLLAIHLSILWFTETAAMTPPVALAAFVAASIAGTTMWKTALQGMRLAISIFVMPFVFVFGNILSEDYGLRFLAFAQTCAGLALYAAFVSGYVGGALNWPLRLGLVLLVGGLVVPVTTINIAAFALTLLFFGWRILFDRTATETQPENIPISE